MKPRDRIAIVGVLAVVVVGAAWLKVVSPERAKVRTAESKVTTANQQLQSARGELSAAKSAQRKYAEAYASIVRLGKAVPAADEVPALVYELEHAANSHHVEFASITSGGSSGSSSGASSAKAGAAAGSQPAVFTQMPFTFTFSGTFADLYHLLTTLQGFATYAQRDGINVTGRLLTIQDLDLVPATSSGAGAGGSAAGGHPGKGAKGQQGSPSEQMTGTVTAAAYVLPPSVGLTGGATPSGPSAAGKTTSGGSSGGSGSSAAPAAATIKAAP
jgi:hypothetical protein